MKTLSPMMQQYLKTHEEVPDALLLFRLGDFYELFFDDAITASRELNLVLTGRDCGLDERAPMCGVPYHAADSYIAKLVDKGYKVAICEQMSDPKDSKGLVDRAIIRVITAGTITDSASLKEDENNFLMCVYYNKLEYGICYTDISTGETKAVNISGENANEQFIDLIGIINPKEVLVNSVLYKSASVKKNTENVLGRDLSLLPSSQFNYDKCEQAITRQLNTFSLSAAGIEANDALVKACGALISYLLETQKLKLNHVNKIIYETTDSFMHLDYATKRNLELVQTISGGTKNGSLIWVLDETATSIGARTLRGYINEPLVDINEITKRHDAVSRLCSDMMLIEDIRFYLKKFTDIQRIVAKIGYKSITGKEMLALKETLGLIPKLKLVFSGSNGELLDETLSGISEMSDIYELIDVAINEECSNNVKDGNLIKEGYNEEADYLRSLKTDARGIMAQLEKKEREKSGINNLKVKYNKVFGYYIEVSKGSIDNVPDYFIRKQTLVNAERYYTEELKQIEIKLISAQEDLIALEEKLYEKILIKLNEAIPILQKTASNIGVLDVLNTFALVSKKNRYARASLNEEGRINIKAGRHPVVEKIIGFDNFIPNDVYLDEATRMLIITGPNMAGKSTYIRQNALILLMNQIGCFVPCDSAELFIADRIFTRVGANDDLASGQSTFMVEMSEVANILRFATKNSFVILDEVGRGTGTADGLSIAWASAEYLINERTIACRTLFATHYHELTEFVKTHENAENACVSVQKTEDGIIFLHQIKHGSANKSYGIEVAKLAGIPESVTMRAEEILSDLEKTKRVNRIQKHENEFSENSLLNYVKNNLTEQIKDLPLDEMTPIEVTNFIYKIQKDLKGERK